MTKSVLLEIAGAVCLIAGTGLVAVWLGLVVAGVLFTLAGVALDPPTRKAP